MTVGMIEAERRSQAGAEEPPETPEQAPFVDITAVVRPPRLLCRCLSRPVIRHMGPLAGPGAGAVHHLSTRAWCCKAAGT